MTRRNNPKRRTRPLQSEVAVSVGGQRTFTFPQTGLRYVQLTLSFMADVSATDTSPTLNQKVIV